MYSEKGKDCSLVSILQVMFQFLLLGPKESSRL
jgi:hypothetical protein